MICKIILLLLLLILIINQYGGYERYERYEGYERCEGYQNNKPPPDKPDEILFKACHDYGSNNNLGNNNYKLHSHKIGEPLEGNYSDFLNIYNIRNYDEFFHAPICEDHFKFNNISSLDNRLIALDNATLNNLGLNITKEEIYENENNLDKINIKDPNYVYVNPKYIGNKLLYSNKINELFLKNHDSHNKDLLHRLDDNINQPI